MIQRFLLLVPLLVCLPFPTVYADDLRTELLQAADSKASGQYVRTHFLSLMKKPFDSKSSKKKALIIGDSHAQDFLNVVVESQSMSGFQIRTRYIPGQCQVAFREDASTFIAAKDKALCNRSDNLTAMKPQIAEADLVILVGNWRDWSAKLIARTIQKLGLRNDQKLVVIGRKSFGAINVRNYLRMSPDQLRALRNPVDQPQMEINNILRRTLDDSVFVDIQTLLCGQGSTCPVFTNDLKLISFDGGHLTPDGARHVGKIMFTSPALASIR